MNRFIHIPKTAGTSISNAIGQQVNHGTYRQIMSAGKHDSSFIFTCVRNPYDRAISSYQFAKNQADNVRADGISLDYHYTDAVNVDDFWANKMTQSMWECHSRLNTYIRPQYKWTEEDDTGGVSDRINHILRYESLDEGWSELQNLHSFPDLPVDNVTPNKDSNDWDSMLSSKAKSCIAQYYADDFNYFNYTQ